MVAVFGVFIANQKKKNGIPKLKSSQVGPVDSKVGPVDDEIEPVGGNRYPVVSQGRYPRCRKRYPLCIETMSRASKMVRVLSRIKKSLSWFSK